MNILPTHLKVGVIRGGLSPEYDVSLKTGSHILEALSDDFKPIDIFISSDGVWHMNGLEKRPTQILKNVDVVYNALHGHFGEDGKIQEILDSHGVKYNGSGKYESSIAMNKFLAKEHIKNIGIKTPVYNIVRQTDDVKKVAKDIFVNMIGPFIVKQARGGSAIDVKLVKTFNDLYNAIYEILSTGNDAIVEEYIKGREASVLLLENFRQTPLYSFPPAEIKLSNKDFFDYDSKYNDETEIKTPGDFSEKQKKELEDLAKKIHSQLGLKHYSVTDFIVTPRRGIYFLEVNTLPKINHKSVLVKSLESVGSSIKEFVHHILNLATR